MFSPQTFENMFYPVINFLSKIIFGKDQPNLSRLKFITVYMIDFDPYRFFIIVLFIYNISRESCFRIFSVALIWLTME